MKIIQTQIISLLLFCLIEPLDIYSQTTRVSIAYNANIENEYIGHSFLGFSFSFQYLLDEEVKFLTSTGVNLHDFRFPTADASLLLPLEFSIAYQLSKSYPVYLGGGLGYYYFSISYAGREQGKYKVDNSNFGYHFTIGYDKYDEGFFIETRFFNIITELKEVEDIYDIETGYKSKVTSKQIDINSFAITLGFYL